MVGNTMIDSLLANQRRLRVPNFWEALQLKKNNYFVVTLHRPANVDKLASFSEWVNAIVEGTHGMPVIFPVHPRTAKTLQALHNFPPSIKLVDPQPYLEFNYLVKHALGVITDSGGVTEETTVMGVPCLTLRDTIERPETVTVGTNELIGTDPAKLKPALDRSFAGKWKKGAIPEKWDGHTAERIVAQLEGLFGGCVATSKTI
ncbi:UDP-N-acetyl glucosamine 2-epimerase [Pusillimonas sp. ANT_WB101]|uniref:UDP-N-acetyl glucosamine 2-epimerase n=1 Tax=Pusillimonas sp. ANT_WB101 TaxID=2597356 RepID=UPI00210724FB|nr:UDP-N-acetylglucosamine 2-epimerase [Pusillimonas sp. ANT_WB101]